jgi:hypothetical protein
MMRNLRLLIVLRISNFDKASFLFGIAYTLVTKQLTTSVKSVSKPLAAATSTAQNATFTFVLCADSS